MSNLLYSEQHEINKRTPWQVNRDTVGEVDKALYFSIFNDTFLPDFWTRGPPFHFAPGLTSSGTSPYRFSDFPGILLQEASVFHSEVISSLWQLESGWRKDIFILANGQHSQTEVAKGIITCPEIEHGKVLRLSRIRFAFLCCHLQLWIFHTEEQLSK